MPRGIKEMAEASPEDRDRVMSAIARMLCDADARAMFDDLDQSADHHGPLTRQLYLALYRRLHG